MTFTGKLSAQHPDEFSRFLKVARRCHSYLEIGCRYGDCFYEMVRAMPKGSLAVAVDWPNHAWGRRHSERSLLKVIAALKQDYRVSCILANSQLEETRDFVLKSAHHYDLVFIDADHRYEGVKRDFELYGALGKRVALHDIVGHDEERYGVKRLWNEIKDLGDSVEFVAPDSLMGIGVMTWQRNEQRDPT